ncbi:MAG: hypothetical protein AMXMBFR7_01120 [Planctomycetota bacterium]
MSLTCFTKLLKPWSVEQLIAFAKETGLAGYDLTVRDGYAVTPDRIERDLGPYVKRLKDASLSVPLVTFGVRAYKADEPIVERAWAACAEAGVPAVKLGYWTWSPQGPHYWDQVKTIRKELAGYAKLAARFGVQALFHNHSDPYYGLNASALMHLIQDLDPAHVGAYVDPAHLALDGEPLGMAIDILRGRIAMVAVKNSFYQREQKDGKVRWNRGMCGLQEGLVDWPEAVQLFRAAGYAGPFNLHAEYDDRHEVEQVVEALRVDIKLMRRATGEV